VELVALPDGLNEFQRRRFCHHGEAHPSIYRGGVARLRGILGVRPSEGSGRWCGGRARQHSIGWSVVWCGHEEAESGVWFTGRWVGGDGRDVKDVE
jgi:hypothetical protein